MFQIKQNQIKHVSNKTKSNIPASFLIIDVIQTSNIISTINIIPTINITPIMNYML